MISFTTPKQPYEPNSFIVILFFSWDTWDSEKTSLGGKKSRLDLPGALKCSLKLPSSVHGDWFCIWAGPWWQRSWPVNMFTLEDRRMNKRCLPLRFLKHFLTWKLSTEGESGCIWISWEFKKTFHCFIIAFTIKFKLCRIAHKNHLASSSSMLASWTPLFYLLDFSSIQLLSVSALNFFF